MYTARVWSNIFVSKQFGTARTLHVPQLPGTKSRSLLSQYRRKTGAILIYAEYFVRYFVSAYARYYRTASNISGEYRSDVAKRICSTNPQFLPSDITVRTPCALNTQFSKNANADSLDYVRVNETVFSRAETTDNCGIIQCTAVLRSRHNRKTSKNVFRRDNDIYGFNITAGTYENGRGRITKPT